MRIAVIGGGAAGLTSAVAAARAGARVTVYEKSSRVGKKLLATGNGRCNLSNSAVCPVSYNQPTFVAPVLERIGCDALRNFFGLLGLMTYQDGAGRIYPVADASSAVLDVLRLACSEHGVMEKTSFDVSKIIKADREFIIRSYKGEEEKADRVIVTTGGGTDLLRNFGHKIIPFSPILCPLATDTGPIRGLSGLRVKCRATLYDGNREITRERGEILFRDYGVSGIMVFDLSRFSAQGMIISVDLLPDRGLEELKKDLQARPQRSEAEFLTGVFCRRINMAVIRAAGGAEPSVLAGIIKKFRLTVKGIGDAKQAQVTRGGASIGEFNPVTMESRRVAGLYAAGETLDVDGRCGGYNLHWAFASGLTAGKNAGGTVK